MAGNDTRNAVSLPQRRYQRATQPLKDGVPRATSKPAIILSMFSSDIELTMSRISDLVIAPSPVPGPLPPAAAAAYDSFGASVKIPIVSLSPDSTAATFHGVVLSKFAAAAGVPVPGGASVAGRVSGGVIVGIAVGGAASVVGLVNVSPKIECRESRDDGEDGWCGFRLQLDWSPKLE